MNYDILACMYQERPVNYDDLDGTCRVLHFLDKHKIICFEAEKTMEINQRVIDPRSQRRISVKICKILFYEFGVLPSPMTFLSTCDREHVPNIINTCHIYR